MILNKNNVPDIYTDSEDFLCVLRLLDLISNVEKSRNRFINIRNPYQCPAIYLPLAAKYVDYEYDNQYSEDDNRLIMSVYPTLKRYKGSGYGINLAIKTALRLSDTLANIEGGSVQYTCKVDNTNAIIDVQVSCQQYSQKLIDLLNYVRPVGYTINVSRADSKAISSDAFRVDLISGSTDINVYNTESDRNLSTSRYKKSAIENYEISFNTDCEVNIYTTNVYFDVEYTKFDEEEQETKEYSTTIKIYYDNSTSTPTWKLLDKLTNKIIDELIINTGTEKLIINSQIKSGDYLQQFSIGRNPEGDWTSVTFLQGHAEYSGIGQDSEIIFTIPEGFKSSKTVQFTGTLENHEKVMIYKSTYPSSYPYTPTTDIPQKETYLTGYYPIIEKIEENGEYEVYVRTKKDVDVEGGLPVTLNYYYPTGTQYYQICKIVTSSK